MLLNLLPKAVWPSSLRYGIPAPQSTNYVPNLVVVYAYLRHDRQLYTMVSIKDYFGSPQDTLEYC